MAYDGKRPGGWTARSSTSSGGPRSAPSPTPTTRSGPSGRTPTIRWLVDDRPAGSRGARPRRRDGQGHPDPGRARAWQPTARRPQPEGCWPQLSATASRRTGRSSAPPRQSRCRTTAFDAVICLQAWHWFDSPAAARECARVLAPGGTLGIAWHVRDETVPWVGRALRRRRPARGRGRRPARRAASRTSRGLRPGRDPGLRLRAGARRRRLVALASSWSYLALADDRDERLAAVRRGGRVAPPSTASSGSRTAPTASASASIYRDRRGPGSGADDEGRRCRSGGSCRPAPATASSASPRYHSGTSLQRLRVDEHEVVHQHQRLGAPARRGRRGVRRSGPRPRPRRRPAARATATAPPPGRSASR